MCFVSQPKAQPQTPVMPAPPMRADESNRAAVDSALLENRRRKGSNATILTGGLGDVGYGSSVGAATSASASGGKTMLGQ